MIITITWNEGQKEVNVLNTESDVFKEVGKVLTDIAIPNYVQVKTPCGDAAFDVKARGSYVKDGKKKASMYVIPEYNNISGLMFSEYEDAYLTCINPESNNYKFYHLRPRNIGGRTVSVGATYGRIGSERGEAFGVKDLKTPYESYLYWIRYYEKLSKGYVDQSEIYLSAMAVTPKKKKKEKAPSCQENELFTILRKYAKRVVEETLVDVRVTKKQISESKKIWKMLCERKTVRGFNSQLMKLMSVCPRKCRDVENLLAKSESDFARIIDREESLIMAMQGVSADDVSAVGADGIEVYEATADQRQQVLKHLSDTLQPKVKRIWRVIPHAKAKRFNDYLKKNNIKTVKQLWHGSKNENWMSIVEEGLSLHPNAAITGKMLGNGIYFAPSSMKSWGYTSYRGTYWAHGGSDTAFMGLYATAYGKPLDATNDIRHYTADEIARRGCNCVHAKGGDGCYLRNDEIVFFNEDAVLLNYIVEFG